ncbi:hypothetical protein F3G60_35350, partial [Pseudomonas aeruginosa]
DVVHSEVNDPPFTMAELRNSVRSFNPKKAPGSDPLLRTLKGRGEFCQAYADDVVIVFDGDDALHIERRANLILELVGAWGRKNKLLFAPQKTRSMVITNKI